MVPWETGLELFTVVFSGGVFIAAYKVFSFFRRTALAKPLLYISAAFYLFFISIILGVIDREFGIEVFPASEIAQGLFFLSAIYGLYSFYHVYPIFAERKEKVEKAVEKIEEEARAEELRKRKKKVEAELKVIKMRFMKREMAEGIFGRLWAEKEKELAEIEAGLREAGAKKGVKEK